MFHDPPNRWHAKWNLKLFNFSPIPSFLYTGINIITVLIRLGIIAVTVITAVILIIIFTTYAVTVISSRELKL